MIKKLLYIFGVTLIGVGIGFIILAQVGYGPWDIFYANLVELFDSNFTVMQAIVSLLLVLIGFALRNQWPDKSIIIITINSAYLAVWIDLMVRFSSPESQLIGYIMLVSGLFLIAIGVNIARYTKVVLPAMDFFTQSILLRTKLSYGRIKQIIEVVVFIIGVTIGLVYDLSLKIGLGTVIIAFAGGYFVNLTYQPVIKILEKVVKS